MKTDFTKVVIVAVGTLAILVLLCALIIVVTS